MSNNICFCFLSRQLDPRHYDSLFLGLVVDRQLHDHPQHNDNREIKILIKFAQPFLNGEGQKKRKKDVSK